MSIIALIAVGVFLVGYAIGFAVFSESEFRILFSFLCGIAAVLVAIAVAFAGCALVMRGMKF